MSAVKIVKKLSMKVLAAGRPSVPAEGETNWIANIVGIATGTKTGTSNFGDWTALTGNFIASTESKETGEELRFRTGVLFLPDVALFLITPALEQAGKGAQIQFGFRIGVIKDDATAPGYSYVAESLIEPTENDPLELLAAKSLPAPASAQKTLDEKKK